MVNGVFDAFRSVRAAAGTPASAAFVCVVALSSAAAAGPLSFTDEAASRGVLYPIGSVTFNGWGAGFALSDLDNDGDPDIVVAGAFNGLVGVYENDGTGHFTNRSLSTGMDLLSRPSGVSTVDYDNDGDLDVYIGAYQVGTNKLYRNDGGFTFTDVTASAGIELSCPGMAAAWGDFNQDGHIDLYYAVRTLTNGDPTTNQLFRNNGDGTFTDVATALNVDSEDFPSLVPAFFDYDRDGDDDLYVGTDRGSQAGWTNRMYRNDGGVFTETSVPTGTLINMDCMAIAVGDVNFDGYFDMYLTNTNDDGNFLMVYDPQAGAFEDQTPLSGGGGYGVEWGALFADFDNDTHLDIYACNASGNNQLYRGSDAGSWPMIDEAASAGVLVPQASYCVAVADIDGDFDLDMLVGRENGALQMFINHSVDTATNNAIRFRVVGKDKNLYGLGTMVSLTAAGKTQLREARAGVNYKVADEQIQHFGLGAATKADSMVVEFNDGTVRNYSDAPAGETWTLYPMSLMGDINGDGKVNGRDIRAAMMAYTGPGGQIVPGQELFDMDGDFDIDAEDLLAMGLSSSRPGLNYTARKAK
jgi:hypothetical protein